MARRFPFLVLLSLMSATLCAGETRPPNYVVIFCDDMGYADIGPFGAEGYETPHLDKMAAAGRRFTDFHVARSFCSPSRAGLLTGRYPQEVGVPTNFGPKSKDGMSVDAVTISEMLATVGYTSACFGKWHLGHEPQFLPTSRGFDVWYGLPYSNDMWPHHPENGTRYHFPDLPLMQGTAADGVEVVKPAVTADDQKQLTKQYTRRATRFIDAHKEEPFFLYLPHAMPHVPLFASDTFDGRTKRGLYGDVVEEIDWSVGQIIDALDRNDLSEHTLVVFTSDNGPWLRYGDHAGSAGPLRAGKGSLFEGGYRVPCVMQWTGRIPAGSVCNTLTSTLDLLPTFAHFSGVETPDVDLLDGGVIERQITSDTPAPPEPRSFVHFAGSRPVAVRHGRWKLVLPTKYRRPIPGRAGIPGGAEQPVEIPLSLYDLVEDVGETTNVADQHPNVVANLKRMADAHRPK